MIGALKRLYRNTLDRELGVVGEEIAALTDQLDALTERFQRLQARAGMKAIRDERFATSRPQMTDAELRALARPSPGSPPARRVISDWPEQEQ